MENSSFQGEQHERCRARLKTRSSDSQWFLYTFPLSSSSHFLSIWENLPIPSPVISASHGQSHLILVATLLLCCFVLHRHSQVVLSFSFYRQGNWGIERLSNRHKATEVWIIQRIWIIQTCFHGCVGTEISCLLLRSTIPKVFQRKRSRSMYIYSTGQLTWLYYVALKRPIVM